jgi:hypothetical protein
MILLKDLHPVSQKAACVNEWNGLVQLQLTSRPRATEPERKYESALTSWLFRKKYSWLRELVLVTQMTPLKRVIRVKRGIEAFIKVRPLKDGLMFSLRWSDDGESVAVLLEGEPWAFVTPRFPRGCSKGQLNEFVGNTWNQKLYDQLFP